MYESIYYLSIPGNFIVIREKETEAQFKQLTKLAKLVSSWGRVYSLSVFNNQFPSHGWLCDPMHCSLSGSSVHGILKLQYWSWVAIPYSKGSSWLGDQTWVSCVPALAARFLTCVPPGNPISLQLTIHYIDSLIEGNFSSPQIFS